MIATVEELVREAIVFYNNTAKMRQQNLAFEKGTPPDCEYYIGLRHVSSNKIVPLVSSMINSAPTDADIKTIEDYVQKVKEHFQQKIFWATGAQAFLDQRAGQGVAQGISSNDVEYTEEMANTFAESLLGDIDAATICEDYINTCFATDFNKLNHNPQLFFLIRSIARLEDDRFKGIAIYCLPNDSPVLVYSAKWLIRKILLPEVFYCLYNFDMDEDNIIQNVRNCLLYVLAHEAAHIRRGDFPVPTTTLMRDNSNIMADCAINQVINKLFKEQGNFRVGPGTIVNGFTRIMFSVPPRTSYSKLLDVCFQQIKNSYKNVSDLVVNTKALDMVSDILGVSGKKIETDKPVGWYLETLGWTDTIAGDCLMLIIGECEKLSLIGEPLDEDKEKEYYDSLNDNLNAQEGKKTNDDGSTEGGMNENIGIGSVVKTDDGKVGKVVSIDPATKKVGVEVVGTVEEVTAKPELLGALPEDYHGYVPMGPY